MKRYYRKQKTSNTSHTLIILLLVLGSGTAILKMLPNKNILSIGMYIFGFFVILFGIALLWNIIRQERKRVKALTLAQVDTMNGFDFEHYVGELLKSLGYQITYTPKSGDYGTDIIAKKDQRIYSIQLKRYTKSVGLEAVQQAVAAMKIYQCTDAMVITNSTFTKSAKALAESNQCLLIERKQLADWIITFQNKKN